jgi:6-methylsalicylate decarboxylase
MPTPHRIDTHHHIFPPKWLAEERDRILDGAQAVPREQQLNWSPTVAIEGMDAAGTATAIISVSTPGVWFGNAEQSRRLARIVNEYGAGMCRDYKGRFGMFAALPLPDVEGSLREIDYALDVLKLDGIGLMTSYGDTWPGNPKYAPVFDELNRRKAIVYFHPTAPTCCNTLVPGIASAVIEFPTDSTRCVTNLLFSGTFTRCPDIRFIFSHGGGTLPMLAGRIASGTRFNPKFAERLPNGAIYELKKLYVDTASAFFPYSWAGIMQMPGPGHILFGTDDPYVKVVETDEGLAALKLSGKLRAAVDRANALALFPRLKKA